MQGQPLKEASLPLTVAIPTYGREELLIQTLEHFLGMPLPAAEILVLDQTETHSPIVDETMKSWESEGKLCWLRIPRPSIPASMNLGLLKARYEIVLFVDDDIIPESGLLKAHLMAYKNAGAALIAGRVIQPWQEGTDFSADDKFHFASLKRCWVNEFMGGNFSVRRDTAITLGGFDENFVHVAYRYEMEFAERILSAGEKIFFEPDATIHHLRVKEGGTRSFGEYLRTIKPSHAVGAYYYLLRSKKIRYRAIKIMTRFFCSVKTLHHLKNPWWIPVMLIAELWGFLWALLLFLRGPRFIGCEKNK
jgi:glycosyltransferase involved in cell wall biosynthesis